MTAKEALWAQQNEALRHPSELFGSSFDVAGITKDTLKFRASASFIQLLHQLQITLFASREYENLLIALSPGSAGKLKQSFFHLPHPSGIAVDRVNNKMYVAATRNPNQVIEFQPAKTYLKRLTAGKPQPLKMRPSRAKYYPGEYYFHDLAVDNGQLYANSVGMNCVLKIDMNNPAPELPYWWPKCVEKDGLPDTRANFIQLNSIALGVNFKDSYFSASGSRITAIRPGHLDYPVDRQGVIFSCATGEPVGRGLTRPHAARLHNGKVWVANSGYGEVGYIHNGDFLPVFKLNGWTRGLCFIGDILFVGLSRVLPRFRHYAPGITTKTQECAIVALDLVEKRIIGDIKFPFGNQIFGIDFMSSALCTGLPFTVLRKTSAEKKIFSVSL
ncbi:MAG: DUF4915 domain-containing protein [Taibaiella sp.]|nr:DUF4915 domain-containing protein [Taibaiella sp.]